MRRRDDDDFPKLKNRMEGVDFMFFKLDKDGNAWTRDTFIKQNTRVPILVLDDECRKRFGEGVPTWGWQPASANEWKRLPQCQKRLRRLEHRKRLEEAEADVAKAQAKLAKLKRIKFSE